jgi:hypothetical protein
MVTKLVQSLLYFFGVLFSIIAFISISLLIIQFITPTAMRFLGLLGISALLFRAISKLIISIHHFLSLPPAKKENLLSTLGPLPYIFLTTFIIPSTKPQIKKQKEKTKEDNLFNLSLFGLLITDKAKQNFVARCFLLSSLTLYLSLSSFFKFETRFDIIFTLIFFITTLYIRQRTFEYRVKHRLYSTNEEEAREVLNFIIKHRDKSKFTDGKGNPIPVDLLVLNDTLIRQPQELYSRPIITPKHNDSHFQS